MLKQFLLVLHVLIHKYINYIFKFFQIKMKESDGIIGNEYFQNVSYFDYYSFYFYLVVIRKIILNTKVSISNIPFK